MWNPTPSNYSTDPGIQSDNLSPGALLENVIEYVMLNTGNEVLGIIRNTEGRHSRFSEDIGKAVLKVMNDNRLKPIYDEIKETASSCEYLYIDAAHTLLDCKMARFEEFLVQADQLECLAYLAIVCELISELYISNGKSLITRLINKAKESMVTYAERNNMYVGLHEITKFFFLNDDDDSDKENYCNL